MKLFNTYLFLLILMTGCNPNNSKVDTSKLYSMEELYKFKTHRDIDEALKSNKNDVIKLVRFNKEDSVFPASILRLKYLNSLEITFSNISELPDKIEELKYIQYLYLHHNKFKVFPKEVYKLNNLKVIDLSNNQLKELPNYIDSLKLLEELYIDNNTISNLPESLFNCNNLKILRVTNNNISDLPVTITKLKNLTRLYLNKNNLTGIPDELGNMPNLKFIDVSSNKIPRDSVMAFTQRYPLIKVVY